MPTGTIPNIPELKDAINKKWSIDSAPDGKNVPRMYAQDVKNYTPSSNIAQGVNGVNSYSVQDSGNNILLAERLELQSRNNEPLSVADVKKVTGFGEEGSKLVADIANREGVTFSQAEKMVKTAYTAGLKGVDGTKVNFVTDTQIDAFTAGKKDALMNPKTSEGQYGKTLENDLIQQGVPLTDRKNIIQAVTNIERSLEGTKQGISSVISGVRKITNNLAKAISQKVGNVQNIYRLLHTNLKALQSDTIFHNRDLVFAYADTYLDAMKSNDSGRYKEISAGVQNVSGALTEYFETGIMPNGVQNQEAFLSAVEDVGDIVRMAEEMLGNVREQLYGNKTLSAGKNVLSKENSRDIIEESTGAKVSYSLGENVTEKKERNITTIKKLILSIKGRRGLKYEGGRVIRIPNNDMETLRHKFMSEHHYSNRSGGIIDCIDCFGQGGEKLYFYIFYVGEDNSVAPIFRLDYQYIERYIDDVRKISNEMGYNKDEFIYTTSANGKGIDRIRDLAKGDSVYDVSATGRETNHRGGEVYNDEVRGRATDNRRNDFELSNRFNETSNSGGIDDNFSYSLESEINAKKEKYKSGQGRRSATSNRQMRVFPPFNESQSDANEISTRWAHNEDVNEGAMKIAFYHNGIYLIEKTIDSDLGYQIIKKIPKKEYDKWLQKNRSVHYVKDTGKQSNGKDAGQSRSGNRRNDTNGRVKSGPNRDADRHGGEVQDSSGVDKLQDRGGDFGYERDGDYEYRFKDKSDEINYSLESEVNENESERRQDLLHDDSGKRKYSKSSGGQTRKVDGRSRSYKEGRKAASERRKRCQALKDAGHTRKRVILGHRCEVISEEHYDSEMTKLVNENKKNGIDETILVVGGIEIPNSNTNGKAKTAKGMFIETADGRRIVVVQCDNEYYSPKQINDHELVHNDYGSERTQRVKNIILKTLPIKKRNELLGIIQDDYSGMLEDLEGDALEELVADILSGMHSFGDDFLELSKAYWNKDDALIKRWEYEVSKKSFARAVEKGYAREMERINRQLVYDEHAQLKEYIMTINNRRKKLKKTDCKEIGNNFYIWRNKSKTNYEVLFSIPIEGNENFVKFYRSGVNKNDRTTKNIWKMYTSYNGGFGNGLGSGSAPKGTVTNGHDGGVFAKKSEIDRRGNIGEGNRDTSKNKIKYALGKNGLWEMEHIFENDDPEGEAVMLQEWKEAMIEKYGAIPSGENPARDIQVPRKTAKDKKVSLTVRTILEAKATPDEAVPTIEKMVEDGVFSYDAYTDKQAISDAESSIKEYGWDESLDDWVDAVEKGEVSKENTTMGWALYNNAATTTSETERTTAIKTSLKILDAMVRHQRSTSLGLYYFREER